MASLVVFVPLLSSNVLAFTVCWWTLFSFVYTQYLLDTMMLPLSCVGCFRTCLATAKLRRPFPDYMWQCTLDAQKGLDVGNTCRTEKACKQSVRAIAEVERCHLHTTWTLVASSPSSVTDQQMHSSQKQIGLWGSQWTVSPLLTLLVLKISARQMLHRSSERAIDSVMEHYLHIPKDTKKLVNLALLSLLDQLMVLPHSSEMSSHVCNRSTAWCSVSSEQAVAGTSDSDCHCCWCACHADVCCGHCCDVYATLMSVVATVVMYMPRWRLLWPPLWRTRLQLLRSVSWHTWETTTMRHSQVLFSPGRPDCRCWATWSGVWRVTSSTAIWMLSEQHQSSASSCGQKLLAIVWTMLWPHSTTILALFFVILASTQTVWRQSGHYWRHSCMKRPQMCDSWHGVVSMQHTRWSMEADLGWLMLFSLSQPARLVQREASVSWSWRRASSGQPWRQIDWPICWPFSRVVECQ